MLNYLTFKEDTNLLLETEAELLVLQENDN